MLNDMKGAEGLTNEKSRGEHPLEIMHSLVIILLTDNYK